MIGIHNKPIAERVDWLLNLADRFDLRRLVVVSSLFAAGANLAKIKFSSQMDTSSTPEDITLNLVNNTASLNLEEGTNAADIGGMTWTAPDILQLALTEILYRPDVPVPVVLDVLHGMNIPANRQAAAAAGQPQAGADGKRQADHPVAVDSHHLSSHIYQGSS